LNVGSSGEGVQDGRTGGSGQWTMDPRGCHLALPIMQSGSLTDEHGLAEMYDSRLM